MTTSPPPADERLITDRLTPESCRWQGSHSTSARDPNQPIDHRLEIENGRLLDDRTPLPIEVVGSGGLSNAPPGEYQCGEARPE